MYLYHNQSMRLVLATATSRIEVIRIGGNKVATERAAYLARAITDKQTKSGRCESPCVIMNYRNAECQCLWKKFFYSTQVPWLLQRSIITSLSRSDSAFERMAR